MFERFVGRSRRTRRLRLGSLAAGAAGVLYLAFAVAFNPLDGLRNTFTDALFRGQQGSPNITIVGIDDAALDQYGRLNTWSRTLHVTLIENLRRAGARVILIDILFADPTDEDAALARAIDDAGNVVLAAAGNTLADSSGATTYVYEEILPPAPLLREAAAAIAHVNVETADDGRVRRVPLFATDTSGQEFLSFGLAAASLQLKADPTSITEHSLSLFGRDVPMEDHMTMRINYVGSQQSFGFIPFSQAVSGEFDEGLVQGKVAFVGLTATGVDRHSTPLLGNAAGIEIQANILDTILRARFLQPVATWIWVVAGAALAFVSAYAIPRWRVSFGGALVVLLLAGYGVASVFAFYQGQILNPVDPMVALLLATAVGLTSRVLAGRAAEREVEDLFGRYVSHEVAQELMEREDEGRLALGGEVREITVLFGDIRGFTPLSEGMDPAELVETVNGYFELAVASILENDGVVNKFIGDAIMAVWNAPRDQPEHAILAARAALRASLALESLGGSDSPVRFGIGVMTGPALAGNVGAAGRLEYTVMGETVNTASRFSGAASGGEVWIGERTLELVKDRFETERLPDQQLKGISEAVVVHRLVREISPTEDGS